MKHEEEVRQSGNPWLQNSFHHGQLDKVVILGETPWREWVAAVSGGRHARRLLASCEGFYEKLCAALLNHDPETGLALFRILRANSFTRFSDTHARLPILLLDLFAAKDSLPVADLRLEMLEACSSDHALYEVVLLCGLGGSENWLRGVLDVWLTSDWEYRRARALALLGFSHREEDGERLARFVADQSESWLRQIAETAFERHRRNLWARQWFQRFIDEEDRIQSWAAFRQFLRCVDRRYLFWSLLDDLNQASPWKRDAYVINQDTIVNAAENNEKAWRKAFIRQQEKPGQIWPWMQQYLAPL